jgi:hypothetical protein
MLPMFMPKGFIPLILIIRIRSRSNSTGAGKLHGFVFAFERAAIGATALVP